MLEEHYHREGWFHPLDVLDDAQAAAFRRRFDQLEAAEGRDRCTIDLLDRHEDQPFIRELATHPTILSTVTRLIGPNVLLMATHFFCKYPSADRPDPPYVAWHQDMTYWGLTPLESVTAWYAVDDADRENGCMQVLPRTQHSLRPHRTAARAGNLLKVNQELDVSPEELETAVDVELRAGQCSLHHGLLIHGSLPNRSSRRRCGLTLRYLPTHVRQEQENAYGRRWKAILVAGEDRFGHFR